MAVVVVDVSPSGAVAPNEDVVALVGNLAFEHVGIDAGLGAFGNEFAEVAFAVNAAQLRHVARLLLSPEIYAVVHAFRLLRHNLLTFPFSYVNLAQGSAFAVAYIIMCGFHHRVAGNLIFVGGGHGRVVGTAPHHAKLPHAAMVNAWQYELVATQPLHVGYLKREVLFHATAKRCRGLGLEILQDEVL